MALVVGALLIVGFQVGLGHQRSDAIFSYYSVVDRDVLQSLDWLRENVDTNSVVVASGNRRGFHYSWWIEGYSKIPTYSATDPRSFSYREEKEQTAIAHALLSSRSTDEVAQLAEQHGIGYIFLDKTEDWELSVLASAGFAPAFENLTIVVLRYSGATEAATFLAPSTTGRDVAEEVWSFRS